MTQVQMKWAEGNEGGAMTNSLFDVRQRKYVDSNFQFKTFGGKSFDSRGCSCCLRLAVGHIAVFNQSSRQLNSPTQHSDDSSLGI